MIQFDYRIFFKRVGEKPTSSSPKLPLEEASLPKSIQHIGSHGILKVNFKKKSPMDAMGIGSHGINSMFYSPETKKYPPENRLSCAYRDFQMSN